MESYYWLSPHIFLLILGFLLSDILRHKYLLYYITRVVTLHKEQPSTRVVKLAVDES